MREDNLNKRSSQRLSRVSRVTLFSHTLGPLPCEMVDISLGGICVDTGQLKMPENAAVEVKFQVDLDDEPVFCEAHALVMRVQNSECCLMFDGMNEETHQVLRSLVGDWQIVPAEHGSSQIAAF